MDQNQSPEVKTATQPTPSPIKKTSSGYKSKLILFLILIFIATGLGIYYYLMSNNILLFENQNKTNPKISPVPISYETIKWKSCTNSNVGYTISYPESIFSRVQSKTCNFDSKTYGEPLSDTLRDFEYNWNLAINKIVDVPSGVDQLADEENVAGRWAHTKPINGPIKGSLQYDQYAVSESSDTEKIMASEQYSEAINDNYDSTVTIVKINDTAFYFTLYSNGTFPTEHIRELYNKILSKVTFNKDLIGKDMTDNWNNYINNQLGFSLLLPNEVIDRNSNGDEVMVPLEVIEDNGNNQVYVIKASNCDDYDQITKTYGECKNFIETLKLTSTKDNEGTKTRVPGGIMFHVEDVKNDLELDTFIKRNAGPECNYKKTKTEKDNIYIIEMDYGNKSPREVEDQCWGGKFYYSEKKQIMYTSSQPDYYFYGYWTNYIPYDPLIIESFKFLK